MGHKYRLRHSKNTSLKHNLKRCTCKTQFVSWFQSISEGTIGARYPSTMFNIFEVALTRIMPYFLHQKTWKQSPPPLWLQEQQHDQQPRQNSIVKTPDHSIAEKLSLTVLFKPHAIQKGGKPNGTDKQDCQQICNAGCHRYSLQMERKRAIKIESKSP